MSLLGLLAVIGGGALGSLLRYLLGYGLAIYAAPSYLATLLVNVLGCFAIGVCYALLSSRVETSEALKLFVMTGFLGGFTTFSSFSLDAFKLLETGFLASALFYVFASVLGGLCAAWLAIQLIRHIL